jgi:hypothetical protein
MITREEGAGGGGDVCVWKMAQTMYAHMNKWINKPKNGNILIFFLFWSKTIKYLEEYSVIKRNNIHGVRYTAGDQKFTSIII